MKRFTFNMQPVLNIKLSEEKQQKGELAEKNQVIKDLLAELEEIIMREERARAEFRELLTGGMPPSLFASYEAGFAAFRERKAEQRERISMAEEERDEVQRILVETMKERNILEKLKEKRREEYLEEVKREEAKVIDDFISNKVSADLR